MQIEQNWRFWGGEKREGGPEGSWRGKQRPGALSSVPPPLRGAMVGFQEEESLRRLLCGV